MKNLQYTLYSQAMVGSLLAKGSHSGKMERNAFRWRFPKNSRLYARWLDSIAPRRVWMRAVASQCGAGTNFSEAKWWSILESLAWICLRDGARASALIDGRRIVSKLRIGLEADWCRQMEPERTFVSWWEAERLLLAALRQSSVSSRGTPLQSNAKEDRALEDWDWSLATELPVDSPYVPDVDRKPLFEKVRISASDLLMRWPAADAPQGLLRPSGAPGRPSSMHLVEMEFERRVAAGAVAESVTLEADALARWHNSSFQEERPLTPKAIKNKLSARFREAQASARN